MQNMLANKAPKKNKKAEIGKLKIVLCIPNNEFVHYYYLQIKPTR